MRTNKKKAGTGLTTHEGGPAKRITDEQALRRSVMACMLWEDTFYEEGESIAERIQKLSAVVDAEKVAEIAIDARERFKLRHVPLLLVRALAVRGGRHPGLVAKTLARVVQRPDEMGEFLSIYWKDNKEQAISAQVKRGLAAAFLKFDQYQLAKWNQDSAAVKLRDVMFLVHPKPANPAQAEFFKQLANQEVKAPDTWEVALSSGTGKKTAEEKQVVWTRLLDEKRLGALALLRNLRNMEEAGVSAPKIREALKNANPSRVLPFRFISAARHAKQFESALETLMFKCVEGAEKLPGETIILVDHSGSMESRISGKSELLRSEAAAGLAILAREICENVRVFCFSTEVWEIAPRRGFALRDAIDAEMWGGTELGKAVTYVNKIPHDRLIVLSDEQTADSVPNPTAKNAYMINVAAYQNGVGYGRWTHIDGWSEACLDFIRESERE